MKPGRRRFDSFLSHYRYNWNRHFLYIAFREKLPDRTMRKQNPDFACMVSLDSPSAFRQMGATPAGRTEFYINADIAQLAVRLLNKAAGCRFDSCYRLCRRVERNDHTRLIPCWDSGFDSRSCKFKRKEFYHGNLVAIMAFAKTEYLSCARGGTADTTGLSPVS